MYFFHIYYTKKTLENKSSEISFFPGKIGSVLLSPSQKQEKISFK